MNKDVKNLEQELNDMDDFEKALTHYCGELLRNAREFENTKNRSKRKRLMGEAKTIKSKLDVVSGLIKQRKKEMDEK